MVSKTPNCYEESPIDPHFPGAGGGAVNRRPTLNRKSIILSSGRIQNVAEDMESIQEYGFDPLYYPFEFPPPEQYSDKIVCVTTAPTQKPLPVPAELHIQERIQVSSQPVLPNASYDPAQQYTPSHSHTPSHSSVRTPSLVHTPNQVHSPNRVQTPSKPSSPNEPPPAMQAVSTPRVATPNDQMSLLDGYEAEAAIKATEIDSPRSRGMDSRSPRSMRPSSGGKKGKSLLCCVVM